MAGQLRRKQRNGSPCLPALASRPECARSGQIRTFTTSAIVDKYAVSPDHADGGTSIRRRWVARWMRALIRRSAWTMACRQLSARACRSGWSGYARRHGHAGLIWERIGGLTGDW